MKTLKLTAEQRIRVNDSYVALAKVLNEVKRNTLTGNAVEQMKMLETSVRHLELFNVITSRS